MVSTHTVLLADRDVEALASVRCHLERDGYRVLLAGDGLETLDAVRHARPDVILLDRALLAAEGLQPGRIGKAGPGTRIILLTEGAGDAKQLARPDWDVPDTMVKPLDPCEVLIRVRRVLRQRGGGGGEKAGEMRVGELVIDRRGHEVRLGGEAVHLTPTEFRLLEVLAGQPGRAFTRLELLGRVFGHDYEGLERTVDAHVKNLRQKIEADPADPAVVRTVYGVGYRLSED